MRYQIAFRSIQTNALFFTDVCNTGLGCLSAKFPRPIVVSGHGRARKLDLLGLGNFHSGFLERPILNWRYGQYVRTTKDGGWAGM
jgi:hypothetical protein